MSGTRFSIIKFPSGGGGGGAVSSVFSRTGAVTAQSGDYTFAQIGSTPTTLSGYGITDANLQQITTNGDTTTNPIYLNVATPAVAQTVHYFGDSITAGTGASPSTNRWTTLLSSMWGVTEVNHGISGSTLEKRTPTNPFGATNMVDNVGNIPTFASNFKYLVFAYGVNDVGENSANYNTTNFTSDYTTVINNALGKGWPANRIVLISPWYIANPLGYVNYASVSSTPQGDPTRLASFVAATAALAISFGTQYVDMSAAELASYNNQLLSTLDGLHPTNDGHRFIAQYLFTALPAPMVQNSQVLAANGVVQLNNVKFSSLGVPSTAIAGLLGIDTSANLVMADSNGYIKNNPSGTPGTGTINILGTGYFGNVSSPTTLDVVQVKGSILGTIIRATGTAPSGLTGVGVEVAYSGTVGLVYAFDRTNSLAKALSLNFLGQPVLINSTTPNGSTNELLQINGGINSNFLRVTGNTVGTGLTGGALELLFQSSTGVIFAFDRTAAAARNLNLGFGLSPFVIIGSNTVTGTAPFQVNPNSFFAGTIGVGQSTATATVHIKAGTATANTAPLKLTSGTLLTNPENGAFEYDGTHLYFTATGGVRVTIV